MSRVVITTDDAPKAASYSQAIKSNGLLFVSGRGPFDPHTGEAVGETIQQDPPARQGAKLPIRPKGMRISIALIAEA